MKHRTAIAAWVLAASCTTVGPDHEQPVTAGDDMPAWNGRLEGAVSDAELDPALLARWWTTLEDPLLSALIEDAARANLDLRTAAAQLRQARARRGFATAAQLPSVGASAGALRTDAGGATTDSLAIGLDASWELDLFGGLARDVEAATADVQAAEEARRDVLVSVLAEVALNYVDLRALQTRRAIAESNLELQQETVRVVSVQEAEGDASQLDLDRVRSNLETTRSLLPTLEQETRAVKNRVAVLLGLPPGALDADLDEVGPLPVPPLQVAVGVPAEVLRRRPDVRRAERRLAAETARVGVATAELYPKLSLQGSIGLDSSSSSSLFDAASRVFSLGPRVQWRAFEGGRVRQEIELQSAVQEEALVAYERAVLAALEEVDNAIVAYTQEQLRYASLEAAAVTATRAAELAELRYTAGETSVLEVLDAQRTRLRAEDDLAQSRGLIVANLVRLYKALGGGWTPEPGLEVAGELDG